MRGGKDIVYGTAFAEWSCPEQSARKRDGEEGESMDFNKASTATWVFCLNTSNRRGLCLSRNILLGCALNSMLLF